MRKLGLVATFGLVTLLACGTQNDEEQFIAQHQDALAVFTTANGIMTMPASQLGPGSFTFEKVRAFYPVVCLDLDTDHDGIPDSFDLNYNGSPKSVNPSALPHPCHRCNRGPGVNGDFRLRVKGTTVDLQRGRVSVLGTNTLTIPSPNGPITVNWTAATKLKDGPVGPGAEVRVRGTMSGPNTIAADLIWVLCPGADMNNPGGSPGTPDGLPIPSNDPGVTGMNPDGTPIGTPGGVTGGTNPDGTPIGSTPPGDSGSPSGTPTDPGTGGTGPGINEGPGPTGGTTGTPSGSTTPGVSGTPSGTPSGTTTGGTGTQATWPTITPGGQLSGDNLPPLLNPMPTLDGPGSAPYL